MIYAAAAFVLILLAAAASDVMHYRIPNLLVLLLAGAYIVWAGTHFSQAAWLSHFGAAALFLAGGLVFYRFGQMGAGDVKLLAAVALWTGLDGALPLLLFVSLCGLLALPLILFARFLVGRAQALKYWNERWPMPRVLTPKQGVPYGIAIALGGIVTLALVPSAFH